MESYIAITTMLSFKREATLAYSVKNDSYYFCHNFHTLLSIYIYIIFIQYLNKKIIIITSMR